MMPLPLSMPGPFQRQLEETQDLPMLPQVYVKAMRLAADPAGDATRLQEIIRHDPVLTAKVLKMANSAYYGFRNRIESLQTALVMLGNQELMRLVATASVLAAFPRSNLRTEFEHSRFWYHSAAVGTVAAALTKTLKLPTTGDVFTGGLLHDIGEILLASNFPVEYDLCARYSEQQEVPMIVAEQRILGIDHAVIGGYLAQRWELPEALIAMVIHHHVPERENYHLLEVSTVHLANRIAKKYGVGFTDSGDESPLLSDNSWQTIANQIWPIEIDVEETIDTMKEEVKRSEDFIRSLLGG